ncbi:hypothetical protein H2248_011060 [Termitomyces sp. 'cryptogamus']|nr:hypothetical protein H2248_011060 [Termitomyces sp. 'cryptogamus']
MPLLHTSNPPTFGTVPSGRNHDYTTIYGPDKPGEEAKENARIWKIYLDEAENYNAGMIRKLENIMDSLLVFVRLPSSRRWSRHLLFKHLNHFSQITSRSWLLSSMKTTNY